MARSNSSILEITLCFGYFEYLIKRVSVNALSSQPSPLTLCPPPLVRVFTSHHQYHCRESNQ
ncbi:hypothetical protein ACS0TY_018447 [Phlomoides rotata]